MLEHLSGQLDEKQPLECSNCLVDASTEYQETSAIKSTKIMSKPPKVQPFVTFYHMSLFKLFLFSKFVLILVDFIAISRCLLTI